MPQADRVLTVAVDTPPTGFLADVAPIHGGLVEAAQIRLDGISAILFLMKDSADVPPVVRNALMGLETAVNDTVDLLSVVSTRVRTFGIVEMQECEA